MKPHSFHGQTFHTSLQAKWASLPRIHEEGGMQELLFLFLGLFRFQPPYQLCEDMMRWQNILVHLVPLWEADGPEPKLEEPQLKAGIGCHVHVDIWSNAPRHVHTMVAGLDFSSCRSNHSDRTLSLGKCSLAWNWSQSLQTPWLVTATLALCFNTLLQENHLDEQQAPSRLIATACLRSAGRLRKDRCACPVSAGALLLQRGVSVLQSPCQRLSFGPTLEMLPTGQVGDYVEAGHV